jgi:dienelactone hydrolase
VLAGSGGLYNTDGPGDELGPCSMELQEQFEIWRDLLTARGYAVVMPATFYSRGFCEWGDGDVPPDFDKLERLIVGVFDARAAHDWMCLQPWIDCDKTALLGFSYGASVTLLAMQDDLTVTDDPRLGESGPNRMVRGAIAYYPGCGLEGELTFSLDEEDSAEFYSPLAPVVVQHAEHDSLLDNCAKRRDPQVEQVALELGNTDDWFDLRIHDNAKHGFDASEDGDPNSDIEASEQAQASTLAILDQWFSP